MIMKKRMVIDMTENEALERLQCMRLFMEINDKQNDSKFLEDDYIANEMAIKALEEIQQYRAIGTVEGYKRAIETSKENYLLYAEYKAKVQGFEAIGTIDEFKALKEKSVPKKPIIHGLGQRYCPVCKCCGADHFYCARCGQKLG